MPDVSWDSEYSIEIKGMDIITVHNVAEAFRKHLPSINTRSDAVITTFERIIEVCETITRIGEED